MLRRECNECKQRLHAFLRALNAFKTYRHAVSDADFSRCGLKTGCLPKCKPAYDILSLQLRMDSLQQVNCIQSMNQKLIASLITCLAISYTAQLQAPPHYQVGLLQVCLAGLLDSRNRL